MKRIEFNSKHFQELRLEKGLTQKEFAEKFGLGLQTVVKWENGYTKPRLLDAYKFARFFGVKMEDFIIEK